MKIYLLLLVFTTSKWNSISGATTNSFHGNKTNITAHANKKSISDAISSSSAKDKTKAKTMSESETQSFSNSNSKTKASVSTNAKANSSAAAKAKAYVHTSIESRVKSKQKQPEVGPVTNMPPSRKTTISVETTDTPPDITRPTHAYWTDSFKTMTRSGEGEATTKFSPKKPKTSKNNTNDTCTPCPMTCIIPIICPCPCPIPAPQVIYCPATCTVAPPPPPPQLPCQNCDPFLEYESPMSLGSDCWDCIDSQDAWKRNVKDEFVIHQTDFFNGKRSNVYDKAAVATDHHLCSTMGKNILKKGGSAVDAAISSFLCVEIINSQSTGIGGGGFLVAYDKEKNKSLVVDFRETLPLAYTNKTKTAQGTTILVPGCLKGLELAHKRFGKLPWKTIFEPAIKLARRGFRLHDFLAHALVKKEGYIKTNLGLRELFAPEGFNLVSGNLIRRPKLARTYERIAESGGSDIFYKGSIAKQIVADVKNSGGIMTLKDLETYEAIDRTPLVTDVAGLTFISAKAPSSGATVALMLKIMEKFNWTREDLKERPGLFYHQMVEAMKFSYAASTFLGDPDFYNYTDAVIDYMMKPEVVQKMFEKIDNQSHVTDYYGPYSTKQLRPASGTSHLSIVGPAGDACSITTSINAYFGSKVMSRKLGFIYNNEISDFSSFWPKVYNYTEDIKEAGKRPMSKIAPVIMLDKSGDVKVVAGAAGGFFIPTSLATTLANYLFLKDNITMATTRSRLHCQLFPPSVVIEPTFPSLIIPLLNKYNHKFVTNDTFSVSGQSNAIMGVIQAIARLDNGKLEAVADYRKGGLPDGF